MVRESGSWAPLSVFSPPLPYVMVMIEGQKCPSALLNLCPLEILADSKPAFPLLQIPANAYMTSCLLVGLKSRLY